MNFGTKAPALRPLATASLAAILLAAPVALPSGPSPGSSFVMVSRAAAKDGDRGDSRSGSDRSGRDDGGSRGSGSDSGHGGGGDREDDRDDRRDDREDRREDGDDGGVRRFGLDGAATRVRGSGIEVIYPQGWRERIEGGVLVLRDPAGRIVIRRRATAEDVRRLRAAAR